ncbi:MAG: hypothetical protein ABH881_03050 [bacterium]
MTIICWLAWIYVLFTINPEETNWIGLVMFYISLYLSIVGTAAIIGFTARFVIFSPRYEASEEEDGGGRHQILAFHSVKEAFRQSFLFSLLLIASLFLQERGLFSWVNLLFLVAGISILEFFLLSYKQR